ncbi:MAG: peroxiredoxin-like family protein [Enhygromyxa sp.]
MIQRLPLHLTLAGMVSAVGCKEADKVADKAAAKDPAATSVTTTDKADRTTDEPKMKMKMTPKPTTAATLGTLPEGLGVAVGQPAPDATVLTFEGKPTQLSEVFAGRPTLLVFYRGGWCPFCNSQIHQLTEAHAEFDKRGVSLAAISVDRAEESAKTKARYTIPFPVLADPDLAAHEAFRVTHEAPDEELERLAGFGMDLEAASGRTHHTIAVPSMFLVDQAGVVRWAHADPDYKVRPSTEQLLAAIDGVGL